MRILKKEGKGYKDYYDFLGGILGEDELVVYDRRDAFPISLTKFVNTNIEHWFVNEPTYGDKKRERIRKYHSAKISVSKERTKKKKKRCRSSDNYLLEGQIYHFVLEVGYHRYYFEVERYLDDEDETKVHLNYHLIEGKRIKKEEKISTAPVCLCPYEYRKYGWLYGGKGQYFIGDEMKAQKIDNPILFNTYIPKFIAPDEMWNNIYEYISSLRDKEIVDTRTNEQHIESHGFDKRESFRHRKKD